MASGLPDYLKVVRPRYGAAKAGSGLVTVKANAVTSLLTVTGKGVIYGGLVDLIAAATQENSAPVIKVDGEWLASVSFLSMYTFGVTREYVCPFYLLVYDKTNFVFSAGIMPGMTFESSFELLYKEEHGATPDVDCGVIYSLF